MRVLVLAGGRSAERDVSLASGVAVSAALEKAGCEVSVFDPGVFENAIPWTENALSAAIGAAPPEENGTKALSERRASLSPADLSRAGLSEVDVVFLALHGGDGEDGHLQALLDAAGIIYTGSDMPASAMAMDKHAAKRIFTAEGIPTPNWELIERSETSSFEDIADVLGLPLVVKPNAQGSTVGLTVVKEESQWAQALAEGYRWDNRLIAEEYIPGRELTVALLGDEALPVIEIVPSHGIYDYECKYTAGQTEYICPAQLTGKETRMVQEQGLLAFRALGCAGFGRADFRMSPEGRLYCLEVNTLPGMTETSLVPKAAQAAGVEFPELVRRICELALPSNFTNSRRMGQPAAG